MRKEFILSALLLVSAAAVFAQDGGPSPDRKVVSDRPQVRGITSTPEMQVLAEDIEVVDKISEYGHRFGIDIFIRKKPRVESIMLVETVKDPEGKEPNYAYRSTDWNKINGDEIRMLNGKELDSKYGQFSLISSTIEKHEKFGEAFHIFIPMILMYGYPWSRNGMIFVGRGTFINIRTFEKKYGDYSGYYMDNPFMFDFARPALAERPKTEEKTEEVRETKKEEKKDTKEEFVLVDDYNSLAAEKFAELAGEGDGLMFYSKGKASLADDMIDAVDSFKSRAKVDVVFAIDTTGSMKDDLEIIRKKWLPRFKKQLLSFSDMRIGLILYRDYNDNYNYKGLPVKYFEFTKDMDLFQNNMDDIFIKGTEGGDVPEAVYEALYASLQFYDWRKDAEKKIILIGDAEPHPTPRGPKKISQKAVMKLAEEKEVQLDCIVVPEDRK